jgi:hypothetical protein
MRYSCEKTATYNNIKILCGNAKLIFHFSKTPRARIYPTRIRLIAAHATLVHATFNNKRTAKLKERRANYNDRLISSLKSYNVEKSVRNRIFAGKVNEKN